MQKNSLNLSTSKTLTQEKARHLQDWLTENELKEYDCAFISSSTKHEALMTVESTLLEAVNKMLDEEGDIHILRAPTNAGKRPRNLGPLLAIAYKVDGRMFVRNAVDLDVSDIQLFCAIQSHDPDFQQKDIGARMNAGNDAVLELLNFFPEAISSRVTAAV